MEKPITFFGILTICRDHGKYLGEAIESVQRQTTRDWRMVVVDDGSSDDTTEVAADYAGRDTRITPVRLTRRLGMGGASRAGMNFFKTVGLVTHVAVLDADDVLQGDALEIMARAWAVNPEASMIYSRHDRCAVDLNSVADQWQSAPVPSGGSRLDGYLQGGMLDAEGVRRQTTVGPLRTFSMEAYDKTEGFVDRHVANQDFDITLKLEEVGELVFIPDRLYRYRFNPQTHARHPNCMAAIAAEAAERRARRDALGLAASLRYPRVD